MTRKQIINILASVGVVASSVGITSYHYENKLQEQKIILDNTQQKLYDKDVELERVNNVMDTLEQEVDRLKDSVKKQELEKERRELVKAKNTIKMRTTAYTVGDGYTPSTKMANGETVHEGAVAMNGVPLGTQVRIGGNIYTVKDRCGIDGTVDIYFNSIAKAKAYGVQYREIEILNV